MAFAQSKYLSLLTQSRDAAIERVVDIYQAHLLTRPTVCLVTTPWLPRFTPLHALQPVAILQEPELSVPFPGSHEVFQYL